jgi:anti-sigma B factor antagonist
MEFSTAEHGGVSRIALSGRLDTTGVGQIETRFTAAAVPPGRPVVIDLTGVDFVSSMGLRLLIGTARALSLKRARLALFGARPAVRDTLEVAGLGELVPIVGNEAQAVALVRG